LQAAVEVHKKVNQQTHHCCSLTPSVALIVSIAACNSCLQAAVEVRKQVNQLDNLTTSKAVDALLNAETVALFNNRQLEVSL
jgi:ABC-type transport system involved in Fe-S cluster assembly fused permease/ATPase subunit